MWIKLGESLYVNLNQVCYIDEIDREVILHFPSDTYKGLRITKDTTTIHVLRKVLDYIHKNSLPED